MKSKNCTDDEGAQDQAVPLDSPMPYLEPMQLDSVPGDALFGEEVCNLDPLVTLKLNDLTHLFIINEVAVASELLKQSGEPTSKKNQNSQETFLKALRSFLGSYSVTRLRNCITTNPTANSPLGRPCSVVKVFLPFLC